MALIAVIGICQWSRVIFGWAFSSPSLDSVAVQLALSLIVLIDSLLSLLLKVLSDVPLEYQCTTPASIPLLLLLAQAALLSLPLDKTISDRVLNFLWEEEEHGSLYSEGLEGAIMYYHRVLEFGPDTPGEEPKGLIVV